MTRKFLLAAISGLAMAVPVAAQPTDTVADKFGARVSVMDASLSPSGSRLAVIAPDGKDGQVLQVADLGPEVRQSIILYNDTAGVCLRWCEWASEERLVCLLRATRQRRAA